MASRPRRSGRHTRSPNRGNPIIIGDTPSPGKSSNTISTLTSGANTPATSIDADGGEEKKAFNLTEELPQSHSNLSVAISPQKEGTALRAVNSTTGKRKRKEPEYSVKKDRALRNEDGNQHSMSSRPLRRATQNAANRISSASQESKLNDKKGVGRLDDSESDSDLDDALKHSLRLGRGSKGKEKSTSAVDAKTEEIRDDDLPFSMGDYTMDSDDGLRAALEASAFEANGGGFLTSSDESVISFVPSNKKGKGKAKAERRRRTRAPKKTSKVAESKSDDKYSDVEGDLQELSSDLDFKPASRAKRNRVQDTPSHLSESEEEESEPSDVEVGPGPSTAVADSGSVQEEQRYETAKQRQKRLKREAREARANARAQRTGRSRKGKRSQYQKTLEKLVQHHPELAKVWENLRATPSQRPELADQPEGLTIKLLPFQREGLSWLVKQESSLWKGGILADEMGMGKTIQVIGLLLSDRKKPNLVIAPTVAILQWRNEIEKFTKGFKVTVWHGANRQSDTKTLAKSDVVLASYGILESSFRKQETGFRRKGEIIKDKSAIHSIKWHRVILDEAHNIKERSTNTAKGAFELKSDFRWCLSGTPLQNRVGELYSMIRFLGGDPFAFYFCKMCECKSLHWQFSDRRACDKCGHTPMHHTCLWNNEILKPIQRYGTTLGEGRDAFGRLRLLLDRMMLRRTKLERADDMGLPPRTVEVRRDTFNEEELDLYNSLYMATTRKFSTYIGQGTVLNNYSNIFTLLTRMRQLACHPDLMLRSKTGLDKGLLGENANSSIHVCRICQDEAEDAIMSKCRHIFCRECVRQWVGDGLVEDGESVPECPYCHATLTIDLEGDALEAPNRDPTSSRQGIISRLDMNKWRSSSKIEALVEELTQLRSEDKTIKSLVFSQFVNFLDLIAFRLHRAGFQVCRLEGNMSPEARNKTIEHFMNNPSVTVFLVSLKAGGVALNLTEASRVYLMDPWWNPSVEVQAMDRIHRLGQHRPIIVKRMVIEDSIESRIIELQNKKSAMIEAAIGKDDSAMGRLSVADLNFLFSL